jgi:hypothetical protein
MVLPGFSVSRPNEDSCGKHLARQLGMTALPIHQDLQRLAAAASRLFCRRRANRVAFDLGDRHETSIELTYRPDGKYVRGCIRSRVGGADFELRLQPQAIRFRHPLAGRHGELDAPGLESATSDALNEGVSDIKVAAKVATLARRLGHVSVLKRVSIGIRERRDTLPALPMAS